MFRIFFIFLSFVQLFTVQLTLAATPNLTVRLIDHVSATNLIGHSVHAYEKQPDGSLVWRTQMVTDATGVSKFDLLGLGSGKVYVLQAKPSGYWVKSDEISTPGSYEFRTAKLQVQVLDGRNGSPYALSDVTLLEKQVDSSLKWISNLRTDSAGLLKLDPAQLGVRPYVLRAASKMDGTEKDSPEYTAKGKYTFTVGGVGVTVRLIDHVSNAYLSNEPVHAYEKQPDGALVWRAQTITDTSGLTRFDLAGLGSGKTYVFQTKPFGYWIKSEEINSSGYFGFRVGTTLVNLTDAGTTVPLPAKIITAYEKLPTGVLLWAGKGTTDGQGLMKIDLDRLDKGAIYVLQITNPFSDGKNYFSDLLSVKGVFKVALRKGMPNTPDKMPPAINITSPTIGDQVTAGGFQLFGTVSDDVALQGIRVILTQPSGVILDLPAIYNAGSHTWSLDTGTLPNPALGALHVLVRATDMGENVSEVGLDVSVVNDTTPPAITINSHVDGASVPTGGFVVSGTLTNNTLSSKLTAKLSGGGLPAAEERPIEVAAKSGRWAMMVAPDKLYTTSPLILTLTAKDRAGNTATKTLNLNPSDAYNQAWHVMQRIGFSGAPDEWSEVAKLGPVNYIQQQLSPNSVDDSAFTARQANWQDSGLYRATDYLRRALYSRRQLQEVMTWFWDNHFSTYFFKHKMPSFEMNEGAAFRAQALGNFRNLLGISAKSPAMLYTLDGVTSYMGNPNENYARELMELHTIGLTGGYVQTDVEEAARAFTGWTVKADSFYFNAAQHDNTAKQVLGVTLPANGGQADGEKILDMLARHASTANRICSKLVTLFVADTPVSALVSRCSSTFLAQAAAPDQIAQVLKLILNSPEFLGTAYRGQKFKTPLELALGSTRNLGGDSTGDDLAVELATMGMDLYTNPSPTGYPETGAQWISSGQLLSRIRFIDRLLAATPAPTSTQINLLAKTQALGLETAEGVTGYLLQASLGPNITKTQRVLGLNLLTRNGTSPYFNWLPDAEIRLRQLEKAVMALPEYQYQ